MAANYLELIVEKQANIQSTKLEEYFRHQGITTLPMKVGALVSGDLAALQAAIPGLTGKETGEIPVPEPLKSAVKAIRIVKPRSLL